jgi:hypothetical protein
MKSSVAKSRSMKASSGSIYYPSRETFNWESSATVMLSMAVKTLTMSSGYRLKTGSSVKALNLLYTLLAHPEIWSLTMLIFLYFS